jgi:hypothetical protein
LLQQGLPEDRLLQLDLSDPVSARTLLEQHGDADAVLHFCDQPDSRFPAQPWCYLPLA